MIIDEYTNPVYDHGRVWQSMCVPVEVPSPDEIRKLLAAKKAAANKVEQELGRKEAEIGKRDEELANLKSELSRAHVALTKAQQGSKFSVGELRSKLGQLVEKYQCEPAEQLMILLGAQEPILDQRGEPQLDANGAPKMRYVLDPGERANILLKLMEFRMPKLRSSEMTGNATVDHRVIVMRFGEDPTKVVDVEAKRISG